VRGKVAQPRQPGQLLLVYQRERADYGHAPPEQGLAGQHALVPSLPEEVEQERLGYIVFVVAEGHQVESVSLRDLE
jgi:hypothetical protein